MANVGPPQHTSVVRSVVDGRGAATEFAFQWKETPETVADNNNGISDVVRGSAAIITPLLDCTARVLLHSFCSPPCAALR